MIPGRLLPISPIAFSPAKPVHPLGDEAFFHTELTLHGQSHRHAASFEDIDTVRVHDTVPALMNVEVLNLEAGRVSLNIQSRSILLKLLLVGGGLPWNVDPLDIGSRQRERPSKSSRSRAAINDCTTSWAEGSEVPVSNGRRIGL